MLTDSRERARQMSLLVSYNFPDALGMKNGKFEDTFPKEVRVPDSSLDKYILYVPTVHILPLPVLMDLIGGYILGISKTQIQTLESQTQLEEPYVVWTNGATNNSDMSVEQALISAKPNEFPATIWQGVLQHIAHPSTSLNRGFYLPGSRLSSGQVASLSFKNDPNGRPVLGYRYDDIRHPNYGTLLTTAKRS